MIAVRNEARVKMADEAWRASAPDLLGEVADVSARVLCEVAGLESERAAYLGYHIMRAIAEAVGGTQVYIPKADAIERCARDQVIWDAFDGRNHRELARAHGVTEIHLYRIIKRMRAKERAMRQKSLF